jgi:hypothetical protein
LIDLQILACADTSLLSEQTLDEEHIAISIADQAESGCKAWAATTSRGRSGSYEESSHQVHINDFAAPRGKLRGGAGATRRDVSGWAASSGLIGWGMRHQSWLETAAGEEAENIHPDFTTTPYLPGSHTLLFNIWNRFLNIYRIYQAVTLYNSGHPCALQTRTWVCVTENGLYWFRSD